MNEVKRVMQGYAIVHNHVVISRANPVVFVCA